MDYLRRLDEFIDQIQALQKDALRNYLALTIGAVFIFMSGMVYISMQKSSAIVAEIKDINTMMDKSASLIEEYERLESEEKSLTDLLEKHEDFSSLKSYFEQFCRKHNLKPEQGWAETAETIETDESNRFEEEQAVAIFRRLQTKDMVGIIEKIENDPLLTSKEIVIDREGKTISLTITVAVKKFKKVLED